MKIKKKKGIRRVDSDSTHTHAWYATIQRKSGGVTRVFSDGVYGGKLAAHRAASAWYDSVVELYPIVSRIALVTTIRCNNRSGVAGVSRWPASGKKITGACWVAQWVDVPCQPPSRRKFSVALYGEKQAKRLAIAARHEAIKKLMDAEEA